MKEVMLKLQDKLKCKALGDVSFYLGLHIELDVEKRCMRVHQRKYLEALAANFGQSEGHVATPFPSGFKCVKGPKEESVGEEERRRFHSLVDSLMYTTVNTRPDVAFATGQLDRVVQCPNEEQGRSVAFDTSHDDLQLYLLSDSRDSVSLFDHVSGAAPAPPATADVSTRSQWLSRDATAHLAIRNHLPATECAHFGEHRTAQALYDAVVARYSSPATAALGKLLMPYLFPELSAFATVADLVTHLRTSDARYRAAVPAEFLLMNQPPMFITLYFIVTRLPNSLRSVRDHFLTLDPNSLTVDLLEQHLLAAETSAVAVGAARGTPRSPFFQGCSPSPLSSSLVMTSSALAGRSCLGIAAAALGASAPGTPPGTGSSRCFFRDSTTLTPLPAPVPVRLADPSGGPVVANSSTVLPCPAVPSGSLSGLHLPSFSTNLTRRHLATFTRRPGSSLYTLATEPPQVGASAQVSMSGQVAASCSCRLLSHQTLLWHHRLGHPSVPCLRGMHSRLLVSGLPRSLPPLPPLPAPPCLPCVEGRQRAAPHSSSFPPTTAPLQTLHMDVWGPARVSGQGHERYFLLVVDDYTRYTTVFPLRSKGEVSTVLIPWIRTVRLQLRARFGQDLPVLRLHTDTGGEFSSDLLRDFCRGEGITQSFTLLDSPQQNGIAERRIGLVMEVARTSMIHAAAPHFVWPFAVRYAAHQLNLWPRVSLPETSPTLRWMGKVGHASVFRSYHPASRRVLPSHDVTFDESVPFNRLLPYHSAPSPPPPLFLAPGPPLLSSQVLLQVLRLGVLRLGVAEPGGAGSEGAGSGGAEPEGVEPGGAESEGAESGGAEPRGATSSGGPASASPRLSSQQLREWLVQRAHRRSGAPVASGPGDAGAGGAAVTTGVGDPMEPGAAGDGGVGAGVAGVAGGTVRPRPYFVPILEQVLGVPSSTGLPPPFLCPPLDQSQPQLQPASPLPVPSPYTEQSGGLTERHELASRPVSPVRTARRTSRSRPPPVPGTHTMALRPSSVPLRVPLPAPPESSLPKVPDPESDRARAASPTVARLLASAITDSSFESAAASALVAELLDFAAACRLDYASALVAESVPASPPSVGGECALGTDILEDRQEDFECLAAAAAMDADMASWKSTDTYVDKVPPPGVNIVDGMWIFRVKRPPGSPPAFKARYVARGQPARGDLAVLTTRFHWVVSYKYQVEPLPASLQSPPGASRVARHTQDYTCGSWCTSLPPFYVLVYVDDLVFAMADTEALTLVKSELQKRHTCTDLGELRSYLGLQITRDRAQRTIRLTQSHMVHQLLQRFGFQYSSPQLTPLSTSHSLSAPPSDESVEPSGPYPELVGCLMYLLTCTRPDLAYPLSLLAHYVAPGRHQKVHWDAAKRVLRYLCKTSGMAAQELHWLTYLLTDLGEQPRLPRVLYVDNKAMIALCQEHGLDHITKHIALRYFLARELQQRGQLRLAYVATRANAADVFTKALPPGDHQCFVTVLGLVSTLPHLLTA
ncbi:unnamed protein product [Closterium sp. NIES-53]